MLVTLKKRVQELLHLVIIFFILMTLIVDEGVILMLEILEILDASHPLPFPHLYQYAYSP